MKWWICWRSWGATRWAISDPVGDGRYLVEYRVLLPGGAGGGAPIRARNRPAGYRHAGMDGFEVARRLRAEYGAGPVLIALTGYGQTQDREETRAAGFDQHLVRPVDLDSLRKLLDGLAKT